MCLESYRDQTVLVLCRKCRYRHDGKLQLYLFMECDVNFDLPVTMWSLTGHTVGLRVVFSRSRSALHLVAVTSAHRHYPRIWQCSQIIYRQNQEKFHKPSWNTAIGQLLLLLQILLLSVNNQTTLILIPMVQRLDFPHLGR